MSTATSRRERRTPAPRSLADELRGWDDDALACLLARRPDLAVPPPADLTGLAARAGGRAGVLHALNRLDTAEVQVLEVLAALPEPVAEAEVSRRWGADATGPLGVLRALALVWGPADGLRLVRAARDLVGPHPAGLGPPLADALGRRSPQRLADLLDDLGLPATGDPETALRRLTGHLGDPDVVAALLARAPDDARAVLDRLTWDTPVGSVDRADRAIRAATAASPVEWLLATGLLSGADPGHVVLPREIGLVLRGGVVHRRPEPGPPPLRTQVRPASHARGTAVAAAAEAVRRVAALGEAWGETPPPVLRSGGLGVRELRRTAQALGVTDAAAAVLVEVACAAGLVADDGETDPRWAPTPAFDDWLATTTGARWATLAGAWLTTTRTPHLVGTRDGRNAPRTALGPDLDRPSAPVVRAGLLAELAAAVRHGPEAPDPASVRQRLDWFRPRLASAARDALLDAAVEEAELLGVTGAGVLAPHAMALLGTAPPAPGAAEDRVHPDPDAAATALDEALPEPVDRFLLQADLTAVVPGTPDPALAAELDLLADVESRGGATVYRFTATSLRRALDAGYDAADVLTVLRARAATPVPQPLEYLVTETARRHGRLRVGAAGCYLRADDETLLAELLTDTRAAPLLLRRLAPTVLVSPLPPETLLERLRSLGLGPAAETPDGEVVAVRPRSHRAPRRRPDAPRLQVPGAASLAGVVRLLRAADELVTVPRDGDEEDERGEDRDRGGSGAPVTPRPADEPVPAGDPVRTLAVLRAAAAGRITVRIGYAGPDGAVTPVVVEPLTVEGGRVSVLEGGRVRALSIHRIAGVVALPEVPPSLG
ncbi:MAG: helicase-associated domain-containing protein [Actinomycetales bacterium]|nr:helicase-associated domain-containing protein [Actinomycetales bacterium]